MPDEEQGLAAYKKQKGILRREGAPKNGTWVILWKEKKNGNLIITAVSSKSLHKHLHKINNAAHNIKTIESYYVMYGNDVVDRCVGHDTRTNTVVNLSVYVLNA